MLGLGLVLLLADGAVDTGLVPHLARPTQGDYRGGGARGRRGNGRVDRCGGQAAAMSEKAAILKMAKQLDE